MKLLTFIIPLYNREDTIIATLESVLLLDRNIVSIIVVDDGSIDKSREIAKEFAAIHDNISFYCREDFKLNKGASVCRNIGLSKASTPCVHFLDSDDLVKSDALEIISNAIKEKQGLDFYVFQTELFDFVPGDRNQYQTKDTGVDIIDRFVDEKSVWNNFGPVWKKESLLKIGGFQDQYTSFQDWDLMMRALLHNFTFDYFRLDYPIWYYRQHSSNTISNNRYKGAHIQSNFKMILSIYNLMTQKEKDTEIRRKYLANFATQVLFRTLFDKETIISNLFEELLNETTELFNTNELTFLSKEYKIRKTYQYNRFGFYRNLRKKKVHKSKFSYLFYKENISHA